MASIKEEGTRGKRLSYKFRVCLGRDENGRQISKAMRWNPPEDMTPAKARKEAQRVAAVWEAEQKEAFERQKAQQEGRKTDYDMPEVGLFKLRRICYTKYLGKTFALRGVR